MVRIQFQIGFDHIPGIFGVERSLISVAVNKGIGYQPVFLRKNRLRLISALFRFILRRFRLWILLRFGSGIVLRWLFRFVRHRRRRRFLIVRIDQRDHYVFLILKIDHAFFQFSGAVDSSAFYCEVCSVKRPLSVCTLAVNGQFAFPFRLKFNGESFFEKFGDVQRNSAVGHRLRGVNAEIRIVCLIVFSVRTAADRKDHQHSQ